MKGQSAQCPVTSLTGKKVMINELDSYLFEEITPLPHWIHSVRGQVNTDADVFCLMPCERHILAGPNGCGKSIILELTAAMYELMSGKCPVILTDMFNTVLTHCGAWEDSVPSYNKMFSFITLKLVNGAEATLTAPDTLRGEFTYTCDDEVVKFRMPDSKNFHLTKDRTGNACALLDSGRICAYTKYIMKFFREAGGLEFDKESINKCTEHFMFNDRYPVSGMHPCDGFPEVNPMVFSKSEWAKMESWVGRHGHGEIEMFTQQLAFQKNGVVLVDNADCGMHIDMQEKYNRMLKYYAKTFGTQVIFSTHSPSMVMEARDCVEDLIK